MWAKSFPSFIPGLLLGLLGLLATACQPEPPLSPPNILLLITDDQGYADLSLHGSPDVATPHLDALGRQSLRFENFHVSPTCAPTRSALMTGKFPFRNGITHTILERERMSLAHTTVAEVLKTAGYQTGIFGKWHLGDEEAYQPGQRGFGEVFIHGGGGIGQSYPGSCADAPDNSYFDPVIRHNGSFVQTEGFCTDVFFRQALGWIKEQAQAEQPFFAYLSLNAPHGPFLAPESYKQKFIDQGYPERAQGFYAMIENIDDNVGLLTEKLEAWGLAENTVLIFMSDNGKSGGGRNQVHGETYNAGMTGMKGSEHEGGTRVPFFLRWPGQVPADATTEALAAHVDLLPTLAGIAGADISGLETLDGRSLLPLLQDPQASWEDRMLFVHPARWPKFYQPGPEAADDPIIRQYTSPVRAECVPDSFRYQRYAVRSQGLRLINGTHLFDYRQNHTDTTNVITAFPEQAAQMQAAYDTWWEEMQSYLINEEAELAPEKPFHVAFYEQQESGGIPRWEAPDLE